MIITVMMASVVYAASVEEEQAEMVRIYEDMLKFEKRGNWDAIERKYLEILTYKKGEATHSMHALAAQASNTTGDVGKTRIRLERALAAEEIPETKGWLDSITANFVAVEISVASSYEIPPELQIANMPFFPDQQQAITFASKKLAANGKFKGMLPLGEYTMGSTTFSLQQGMTGIQKVKISESVSLGEISPRINVGLSAANAGESTAGQEADPFKGYGTRLGVGLSMDLGSTFGFMTEVGYHSAFKGGEEPSALLQREIGAEVVPTRYNAGYVWLAGQVDISSFELSVGPIVEYAKIRTQGIDGYDFAPVRGTILASGVSAGLTYYGFSLGAFDGGISTQVGAQSDSSRLYSWGQVAFTMNGSKK